MMTMRSSAVSNSCIRESIQINPGAPRKCAASTQNTSRTRNLLCSTIRVKFLAKDAASMAGM